MELKKVKMHLLYSRFSKQDTEVRYWAVTAISNDYIIEIGYELM